MPIDTLKKRLTKGSPLTAAEGDANWDIITAAINAQEALIGVSLKSNGALKDGSVSLLTIPDRLLTLAKLAFLTSFFAVDSSVVADVHAISFTPVLAGGYVAGQHFFFKAGKANTGPATLNVDGNGAVAIKKQGSLALTKGDILAGQIIEVMHDGTYFQYLSAVSFVVPVATGVTFVTQAELATNTAAVGWTTVDVSASVPATAKYVVIQCTLSIGANTAGLAFDMDVRKDSTDATGYKALGDVTDNDSISVREIQQIICPVKLTGAVVSFDYKVTFAGVNLYWQIALVGYGS